MDDTERGPEPVVSPYTVTRIIKEVHSGPEEAPTSRISAMIQRKRRDDGKMSREFVSIKCELGKKIIFFSVANAIELLSGLGLVLSEAREEDTKLREAWEAQRAKFRQDWETQISDDGTHGNGGHRTGKTERDKKKDSYKPYDKRKQEKAERDRKIREDMRRSGGGR